jgi:hypothetical protein
MIVFTWCDTDLAGHERLQLSGDVRSDPDCARGAKRFASGFVTPPSVALRALRGLVD